MRRDRDVVRAAICSYEVGRLDIEVPTTQSDYLSEPPLLADMRFINITRAWRFGPRALGASQTKTGPCGKQEHRGGKNSGDEWHWETPIRA
jgi:hypothetical protein